MTGIHCPRCGRLHDGSVDAGGWAECAGCGHRWLAQPGRAADAPADVAPVDGPGSDEYQPRTAAMLASKKAPVGPALTARHDQDVISPDDAQGLAADTRPVPPASLTKERSAARIRLASGTDLDLFDEIEREIEHERAQARTMADASFGAGADAAVAVTVALDCPVCGHHFETDRIQDRKAVCPQCDTVIEVPTHRVVRSNPPAAAPAEKPVEVKVGSGETIESDDLLGMVINGCRIDRKLGEGGMGSVYHARQISLDRSVAIKILPPELKRDKKFLRRFEQEAKSLARINHPNILHAYDFGEDQATGIYFMIMEYADGADLAEVLKKRRRIPQVESLDLIRQSALGLAEAADKGVIHRDIKPDNLICTQAGLWKVTDFGLAKQIDASVEVTRTGIRVGTPAFMSPEQCDGRPLDFRSDIYSLGVTLYVALTGRLPFDADSPFAIMLKHKTEPVPSVRAKVPDVDARVDALVARMMAKDPADRFDSFAELLAMLEDLLRLLGGERLLNQSGSGPYASVRLPEDAEPQQRGSRLSEPEPEADSGLPPLPAACIAGGGKGPEKPPSSTGSSLSSGSSAAAPVAKAAQLPGEQRPLAGRSEQPAPVLQTNPDDIASILDSMAGDDLQPVKDDVAGVLDRMAGDDRQQVKAPSSRSASGSEGPLRRSSAGRLRVASSGLLSAASSAAKVDEADKARSGSSGAQRRPSGIGDATGSGSWSERRQVRQDQADHRLSQRAQEVRDLEETGDRQAARRRYRQAIESWRAASQRSQKWEHRELLLRKIERAGDHVRRARSRRRLIGIPVLLVVSLLAVWQLVPSLLGEWTRRELTEIREVGDEARRLVLLEDMIARVRDRVAWYEAVFGAISLPAVDEALDELERLRQAEDAAAVAARREAELAALLRKASDPEVSWESLLAELDQPQWADHANMQALRTNARQRLRELQEGIAAVNRMLGNGHVSTAIERASRIRSMGRLGDLERQLPWPVELVVSTPEGPAPEQLRIHVDGVELEQGSLLAYRFPDRDVQLEIAAPGYTRQALRIERGGADAASRLAVMMRRGRIWEERLDLHRGAAWVQIHPLADGRAWVLGAQQVALVQMSDGHVLARATPAQLTLGQDPQAVWLPRARLDDDDHLVVAASSGEILSVGLGQERGRLITRRDFVRLGAPAFDWSIGESALRADLPIQAVLAEMADGPNLVVRSGSQELGRHGPLRARRQPPRIKRLGSRLFVFADDSVIACEENGRALGTLTLEQGRQGEPIRISTATGPAVLLPLTDRLALLHLAEHGDPMRLGASQWPLSSPVVLGPLRDAQGLLALSEDGTLLYWQLDGGRPQLLWQHMLGEGAGQGSLALSPQRVAAAVGDGLIGLWGRDDGRLQLRIDHGMRVLALYLAGDLLIVYGADGRLVAYDVSG